MLGADHIMKTNRPNSRIQFYCSSHILVCLIFLNNLVCFHTFCRLPNLAFSIYYSFPYSLVKMYSPLKYLLSAVLQTILRRIVSCFVDSGGALTYAELCTNYARKYHMPLNLSQDCSTSHVGVSE